MLSTVTSNIVNFNDTETQINRCKDLRHQIDVLQAEFDRVKKSLVEGHFSQDDTFTGSEGLILATYKSQNRAQFLQSEFKKDHPKLYEDYCVTQPLKVFLIKK